MFKTGDRVRIVGADCCDNTQDVGKEGKIITVDPSESRYPYRVSFGNTLIWYSESSLELIEGAVTTMTQEKFDELLEAIYEYRIKGVMCKKSAEYARNNDKLYNFRRAAEISGKTPLECLRGMKLKHDVSVDDMLNDERNGKEHPQALWMEKLSDQINYTLLAWALLHEKYNWEVPQ